MVRHRSIRSVIVAALLPIFVTVIVAMAFLAWNLRAVDRGHRALVTRGAALLKPLDDARAVVQQYEITIFREVADAKGGARERDRAELARLPRRFDRLLATAIAAQPSGAPALHAAAAEFAAAATRAERVRASLDAGRRTIALARAGAVAIDLERVADALDARTSRERQLIQSESLALKTANFSTVVVTIAVIFAGLAAAFAFALVLVRKNVLDVLLALHGTIRAMADGRLDVPIPHRELDDELGEIARSLVVLQEVEGAYARDRWIEARLADVNERLRRAANLDEFASGVLDGITAAIPVRFASFAVVPREEADSEVVAARASLDAVGELDAPLRFPVERDGLLAVLDVDASTPITDDQRAFLDAAIPAIATSMSLLLSALRTAELQEHQRLILDTVASGIVGVDERGCASFVNPSACALLGYSAAELQGADLHRLTHHSHPDGRPYAHEECPVTLTLRDGVQRAVAVEHFWRRDGMLVAVELLLRPILVGGVPRGVVVAFNDITERLAIERERDFTQYVTDHGADAKIWTDAGDGRIVYANIAARELLEMPREHLIGTRHVDLAFERDDAFERRVEALAPGDAPVRYETRYRRADGAASEVEIVAFVAHDGARRLRIETIRDIGDRKALRELRAAQQELGRINRALRTISVVNAAIVRASDERTLLQRMCEILVEVGGYAMAWVGFAENDADKNVRAVARAGEGTKYLDDVRITWADEPAGQGPLGATIREGRISVVQEIESAPTMAPWARRAAEFGLRSMIAVPLASSAGPFGGIALYASEPDAFGAEEAALIAQLGEDISFGVTSLRLRDARDELRVAKDAAEAAATLKSEFLANMSHEIRTPMNAIVGLTYLMQKTELDARQREYLKNVQRSSELLLSIVNDVLDFSKIDAGMLTLETIEFALDDVLANVDVLIAAKAQEKELAFSFEIDPAMPASFVGDPLRLGQVLINLCNNAVKFTDEGRVVVRAHLERDDGAEQLLSFAVSDTGIGVAPEKIPQLFAMFTQADASTTRKYGGSGLGLAISKRLVEAMGGEIRVESAPGAGSTFYFTVRVGAVRAAPPRRTARATHVDSSELRGLRVLIVEDNRINQRIALEVLEGVGVVAEVAENGEAALEKIARTAYDVVLMDVQMPVMDGLEATRRLRADSRTSALPIVAMTGNAMTRDRDACLEAGMNDYVVKPIDPDLLYATLARVCANGAREPAPRSDGERR